MKRVGKMDHSVHRCRCVVVSHVGMLNDRRIGL